MLALLATLASAAVHPAVNITWAEFTDPHCKLPLGQPVGGLNLLGKCGVGAALYCCLATTHSSVSRSLTM